MVLGGAPDLRTIVGATVGGSDVRCLFWSFRVVKQGRETNTVTSNTVNCFKRPPGGAESYHIAVRTQSNQKATQRGNQCAIYHIRTKDAGMTCPAGIPKRVFV